MNAESRFPIRSMTGFGTADFEDSRWHLNITIRSVNHRYFDWNYLAPIEWQFIEPEVRRLTRERIHRGSIRVTVRTRYHDPDLYAIQTHETLLDTLTEAFAPHIEKYPGLHLQLDGLMRLSGLSFIELDERTVQKELVPTFVQTYRKALDALIQARETEGQSLLNALLRDLETVEKSVAQLIQAWSATLEKYRTAWFETLRTRVQNLADTVDENRLYQEIAIGLQRMDAHEELDRLQAHFDHFRQTLAHPPCGRKLDFIVQECLREANTLASKSVDPGISRTVLEIKTLIDRLREQVQNLE